MNIRLVFNNKIIQLNKKMCRKVSKRIVTVMIIVTALMRMLQIRDT
jgi:hypothetical protein